MSKSNVAQSVRDRLLNRKRETGENYEALLTRYALERLLYRLSTSDLRDQFVLKGAYAFLIWQGDLHRPTRDLDLLGQGRPEELEEVFRQLCAMDGVAEDGVRFDAQSVEAEPIRDGDVYGGIRVKIDAGLVSAELRLQVDVGFGDAISPGPEEAVFPSLLDFPSPKVRTYPKETVVAEKLHGLVTLGIANSRMRDFYDLWYLSQNFAFEGTSLSTAIHSTFERRETPLPASRPDAFTGTFSEDEQKQKQWSAFLDRTRLKAEAPDLETAIDKLDAFLWPPLEALRRDVRFEKSHPPEGPWR